MFDNRTSVNAWVLVVAMMLGGAARSGAQPARAPTAPHKEAKIPEADARRTALAAVPGGKVQSHELEREHGKLIYSYDIKVAGKPGVEEVNVDAITGAIIAHEHEDAKTERKEKQAEAKERRKP